jgi:two-component system nitrate/nitrite response regulator NarL
MTTVEHRPSVQDVAAVMSRPRVAVVDDNTVIRFGLPLLMAQFHFVGSFPDCESLLERRPAADVVVLDLHLAGAGRPRGHQGVDAVTACVSTGYRVCLYTNERRRHLLLRCLQAGAQGVVHKADPNETLADAIFQVTAGSVVITRGLMGLAELAERRDQLPTLTPRQRQVLSGRARGEAFRSIARRLYISEKTAQEHWSVVTEKFAGYLRTHSAADLERLLGLDSGELFPAGDELVW